MRPEDEPEQKMTVDRALAIADVWREVKFIAALADEVRRLRAELRGRPFSDAGKQKTRH